MPREKKIPTKPRFDFVTRTAYEFLLECGYNRFPISPFDVLEELSDTVTCLPWSEAKQILNSSDPFHLNQQESEARTIRMRNDGRYWIVYDDVHVNSDDRISWTIMHEIGHILLGHLVEFGETALDRGGLSKEKYGVLEVEAHYFAAEFLMPTALLKYFSDITVDEISLLFGVSEPAAQKKYNRVFNATYLPKSEYDQKLIRNFFDFLDRGIEDAIYKNIYKMWGLPWKSQYVPLCRKCPECYTYITDKDAVYCPYCGAEIEQKKQYKSMFARLGEQQKFTRIPGVTHFELPYVEKIVEGRTIQRLPACPVCFNTEINEDSGYCSICGTPIVNFCNNDGQPLCNAECFCPSCGSESILGKTYKTIEQRILLIEQFKPKKPDWLMYPYWGYVRMRLNGRQSNAGKDLVMALLYSKAYIDDDENIIIFTDSTDSAVIIHSNKDIILQYTCDADEQSHENLEVFLINDLQ